jgi:phage baseplate assembly protein gpV
MSHEEFVVPEDAEIVDAFGVDVESKESDPMTQSFDVVNDSGDSVAISYDIAGRSVRVRWNREGTPLLDLYREGATLLQVSDVGVTVQFESAELTGKLTVQLRPTVEIRDALLYR